MITAVKEIDRMLGWRTTDFPHVILAPQPKPRDYQTPDMLLTAGAFGYSYSQPLKRDVHAQEGALVQPPTQLCGVGQKRVADLPRGSTEGKQEVLRGDRKC